VMQCPTCQKNFDVAPEEIAGAGVRLFCDRCKTIFGLPSERRALLIHTSDAMTHIVSEIVRDADWQITRTVSGDEALRILKTDKFRLAIVDVATEAPYAYELVPQLKKVAELHVLLLASVYDKTAYKRRPSTLYGADAYLEQHHLPDKLPMLLSALGGPSETSDAVLQKREALRKAADEQLGNGGRIVTPGDLPDNDSTFEVEIKANALAKKLVLDISLYDEAAFMRGLEAGDLHKTIGPQISEAKRFLRERLPAPLGEREASVMVDRALAELCRSRQEGKR
jgi:predicted Zn finger-like uncharacterized protein